MAKKQLFTDMLNNPARFYRNPGDVLRDRRFADDERREILKAWQVVDDARAAEVQDAIVELEGRGVGHAAE